jgi:hypothetical protein
VEDYTLVVLGSIGIAEAGRPEGLAFAPNPVQDALFITANPGSKLHASVYDWSGSLT